MKAKRNEIDSEILGRPVFYLEDYDPAADFAAFERDLIARQAPYYLGCKVPMAETSAIQALEDRGFRLLEVQFRSTFKMRERFDVAAYPYLYTEVGPGDAEEVLSIAESTFTHDRFSTDSALPETAGGERYRRFVEKSIAAADEHVFQLVNRDSGEVVGFHTYTHSGGKEALFFIAGVKPAYKMLGLGAVLNYFALNEMYDRGVRKIVTHQSAANFPILNLEIGFFGFRIVGAWAVLRKIYD